MRFRVWLAVTIFIVDRFVKNIVWFTPPAGGAAFWLHPVLNRDIAFSLSLPALNDFSLRVVLICLTAFILSVAIQEYRKQRVHFFWWALIGSGALSNVLDRLTLGGVLDYIDFGFWPVFNISDATVSIGIGMLVFLELRSKKRAPSIP